MDLWSKARSFAEEAAKRSHDLTLSDIVTEASKRADQIKSEAVKRADQLKIEAAKRAEQIRSEAVKRADQIIKSSSSPPSAAASTSADAMVPEEEDELESFGITEELRDFVSEITMNTFKDFPLEDDSEMANVPAVSNISQDLTEWQTKHASLVLKTVKEIGKLRYELCPRIMKERKFWRIYFILVNNHVSPYEKRCMEAKNLKSAEPKDEKVKESSNVETRPKPDKKEPKPHKKSPTEQDLDVFLLGEDSDDGADCGEKSRDVDIDEFMESSDDEKEK